MTLDTSCGAIVIALEAARAAHRQPADVPGQRALLRRHPLPPLDQRCLADRAPVRRPDRHRSGQIGFTIAEENTKGAKYTRGTFAMANTGAAKSTQSQFFLVDKDSQLPASYTVAGHITAGLAVLDKILALGNDGSNGTGDGAPKQTST